MPFDKKAIQKSVRAQVFGHWSVLGPLVGAAVPFGYGLLLADDWKLPVFGGVACLIGSIGGFFYGILVRRDKLIETEVAKARAKFEAERNAIADKRNQELDDFHRLLASDEERRDENLLYDLRSIADAFRSDRTWVENVPESLSVGMLERVDSTFNACIAKLERSFKLRQTAKSIRGEGKAELLQTAESELDDVQNAIEELGKYLAMVNKLSIKRLIGATVDQSNVRDNIKEMEALLTTAKSAEDFRQQLLSGASDKEEEAQLARYAKLSQS
ncbi:hypothetical protein A3C09_03885 [Candidatus Uhrbacteria bacterium RIFCSPHIGHO2_02_FULL_47_44]|uniref:Uncharacterized protein n=1 Tax=Candidatus Uhrbacteria bacterium RIFCSPLOWO2_02_FULL_48_18 TaxID=1802408 RepID=A0A1F7VCD6_9BACT|nr:MAG: hypothetical protein A2839_01890 [Candidatus Uhrbacteria bacterium RIFCSPHIGHO2_01_FULL_47_10]OGL71819.1 MAG: hypothetical protein A3C09_03885 [Candidatus Uhrbacteria bacterium RIFCSPHIGHO2_02_FULL_47_44]OGL77044.1 MAG: hypothetical protein A3E97_01430 [Candidatus Uhrbacteria bacterium RIFCSPHIGHO2_12_FULL_47_12]OGL80607.1 MAG: hypothetical protein A3B20_04400 [Candidatus Uhrbacteria bacterium RIFCSPLOWO2_01_FULL_47_17]OGL88210.1 MAG: hypothetical protein A3I41_00580 [Candidatus Uhrbact